MSGGGEESDGPQAPLLAEASGDGSLLEAGASGPSEGAGGHQGGARHSGHHSRKDTACGLQLMTLSAVFFSTMSLLVKVGSQLGLPSFQLVFARSLVQLLLALASCAAFRVAPLGPRPLMGWMFARGMAGALGLACFFFAISLMDLGDATTVFFMGPIFVALFAHLFLGEHITWAAGCASVLSFVGVALVARPAFLFHQAAPQTGWELIGAAAALAGAVLAAVAYVIVRKFSTKVHFLVSVVWFGLASTVFSLVALWVVQEPVWPDGRQWLVLGGLGVAAFFGQCCLNSGLQLAPAGPGTVMRNLDVVFAYIFQVYLLHSPANVLSVLGAALIFCSAATIAISKWMAARLREQN